MKTTVRKSKFSFHLISFMLLIGNLALCQRPSVSLNFKSVCTVNGGRTTKYTFACYNLGAVAFSNPHTPRWELIGNYWQWGRSTKAANGPSNGSGSGNGDGSRAIHIGRNKLLRALQRSQIEQVPVDEQDIVCGNPVERMPIQPGNHRVIAPPGAIHPGETGHFRQSQSTDLPPIRRCGHPHPPSAAPKRFV